MTVTVTVTEALARMPASCDLPHIYHHGTMVCVLATRTHTMANTYHVCLLHKTLLLVKMKKKKLLKIQSLPKVLRSQAMRSTT